MQRVELRRFVGRDTLAEIFLQDVAVFGERGGHVAKDHALLAQLRRAGKSVVRVIAGVSAGNDTLSSFSARMSKRCHCRSRRVGSGSFSNARHAASRWDLSQPGSPEAMASRVC